MTIKDEIESMENLITAASTAPVTEPSSTKAPGTEAPGTESPSTEAPATEAPATEVATEAPSTEAPDEMAILRAELAELKGMLKKPTTEAPSTKAPSTEAPLAEEDFLGDIDPDELTRDPAAFNKVLNKVLFKGIEIGKSMNLKTHENVIRSIPDIVKTNIATINAIREESARFYEQNADLKPYEKVVALTFEKVASANPDKTIPEILVEVGKETRKVLKLDSKARKTETPPKLPSKGNQNRGTSKPNTGALADELSAMDKALEQ